MITKEAKFVVTIEIPKGYNKRDAKRYIKEAIKTWCKSYDPDDTSFDFGDKVKIEYLRKNMTDKEILIQMFKEKLKLKETNTYYEENGVVINPNQIIIGSGEGPNDSYCIFKFDHVGNLTSHGVWE